MTQKSVSESLLMNGALGSQQNLVKNPGFLYQQNTIRDAMVAAITLNIFHKHAKRVHMANIAQTVNVLQAMILTDGEQMVKTPSYHVFDLYKVHQDAETIDSHGTSSDTITYTISKKRIRSIYRFVILLPKARKNYPSPLKQRSIK